MFFSRFAAHLSLLALVVAIAGCATQKVANLDAAAPADLAKVKTVAIATVSVRPSTALTLFNGNRGQLIGTLTKFETELSNALVNQGFKVVPTVQSFPIYNTNYAYEELYVRYSPELMASLRKDEEVQWYARQLKSKMREASSNSPLRALESNASIYEPADRLDRVTSANTRIFPEVGPNYVLSLPRYTAQGGRLDNRFVTTAARQAIGDLTREIGADAYLLVDADLDLSAREEGWALQGLVGGTRYATFDGTVALVSQDGSILSLDRFREQSVYPIGGATREDFDTRRGSGWFGLYQSDNVPTMQEAVYQAIRQAALDLATQYARARDLGLNPEPAADKK